MHKPKDYPVVTVKIPSYLLPPPPKFHYAVLCDRSVEQINAFSEEHPKCWILPFFTKTVEDVPDCNTLLGDYIMRPWYVGNLTPRIEAIKQIVENIIEIAEKPFFEGSPETEWECILDESNTLTV
jgi:hypothetical protein